MKNNVLNPPKKDELERRLELSARSELRERELMEGTKIRNFEGIVRKKVEKGIEKAEAIDYPLGRLRVLQSKGNLITTDMEVEHRHGSGEYIVFKKAKITVRTVWSGIKRAWTDRTFVKERVKLIGTDTLKKIREITEELNKHEAVRPILELTDGGLTHEELRELIPCSSSTLYRALKEMGGDLQRSRDRCGFVVLGLK